MIPVNYDCFVSINHTAGRNIKAKLVALLTENENVYGLVILKTFDKGAIYKLPILQINIILE